MARAGVLIISIIALAALAACVASPAPSPTSAPTTTYIPTLIPTAPPAGLLQPVNTAQMGSGVLPTPRQAAVVSSAATPVVNPVTLSLSVDPVVLAADGRSSAIVTARVSAPPEIAPILVGLPLVFQAQGGGTFAQPNVLPPTSLSGEAIYSAG